MKLLQWMGPDLFPQFKQKVADPRRYLSETEPRS